MSVSTKIKWHISGDEVASCNCAWGCPCQFNALPTQGRCEGVGIWQVKKGHFGDTMLDGLRFAGITWWPGPVHEGNGIMQWIIDEQATPERREALITLCSGAMGGGFFEIFAAVCPHQREPIFAPISFEMDQNLRTATVHIPGLLESHIRPIKNPVTGEEHRARLVLPNGFEFREAEIANAVTLKVTAGGKLSYRHESTHAHLNTFDWSN